MLDVFKSNGPLMAYLQKSTLHSIAPAITKLFNMSIASGKLSKDWKSSLVVPIPKKGPGRREEPEVEEVEEEEGDFLRCERLV